MQYYQQFMVSTNYQHSLVTVIIMKQCNGWILYRVQYQIPLSHYLHIFYNAITFLTILHIERIQAQYEHIFSHIACNVFILQNSHWEYLVDRCVCNM